MKVLHLPSSYFPRSVGGTEQYVHRLCEALSRKAHEVIVAWHGQDPPDTVVSPEYKVAVLDPLRKPSRVELYSVALNSSPPGFADLLKNFAPDVVHFHSFTHGAGIDHARAALEAGIPYVVTYHVPSITCVRG